MDKSLQHKSEEQYAADRSPSQNLAVAIGRNTFFGIIASLTQMSTRFITVPIVIGYLGLDGYGIWSIIMTIAMCMRFGSAGVKSAFQKYVAEATGSGDFLKANKLLSTGSAAMLVLSVVGLIPLAVFADGLARLIGVPDHFLASAAGSISVLALIMVLSNAGAVYEAIVMGAHRIDLTRKFITIFTILEAIAIVVFLYLGYGLLVMSAIMAFSEVGYLFCCYYASRRVLPSIQVDSMHLSVEVLRDLFNYTGSYQVVGVLEVLYAAIWPAMILKWFGGDAAGVFAVASRLVSVTTLALDSFLVPILSGASLVYASGSVEKMLALLTASFKTTLGLTMLPLAFIASAGTLIILAWTGQADPAFGITLWLMCLASLFKSLSLLALVLYRASGRVLLDNIRQILRILVVFLIVILGNRLGFTGVLAGLALSEFIGMVFMLFAMTSTFQGLTARVLLPDTVRMTSVSLGIIVVCATGARMLEPWSGSDHLQVAVKLGGLSVLTFVSALLFLHLSGSVSRSDMHTIMQMHKSKG